MAGHEMMRRGLAGGLILIFVAMAIVTPPSVWGEESLPPPPDRMDTDWLSEARGGVFLHFLPGNEEQFALVGEFDVERLADQLKEVGASYLVITIYQNSGYFNAPNAFYDATTGYASGEKSAQRDLPMDLYDALHRRGIRLMLYVTGQSPNEDRVSQGAFGFAQSGGDQKITLENAKKWAGVFREWSERYGDRISGWWVDGCYRWCDFNEEIAAIYAEALRSGNPNAIVAFNPGVKLEEWRRSDYTAGEINDPLAEKIESRFVDVGPDGRGQQVQILTFLGSSWGAPNTRFETATIAEWARKTTAVDAAVTFDVQSGMDPKDRPVGTINPAQLEQLHRIFTSLPARPF